MGFLDSLKSAVKQGVDLAKANAPQMMEAMRNVAQTAQDKMESKAKEMRSAHAAKRDGNAAGAAADIVPPAVDADKVAFIPYLSAVSERFGGPRNFGIWADVTAVTPIHSLKLATEDDFVEITTATYERPGADLAKTDDPENVFANDFDALLTKGKDGGLADDFDGVSNEGVLDGTITTYSCDPTKPCPTCGGSGACATCNGHPKHTCPTCHGDQRCHTCEGLKRNSNNMLQCPTCTGEPGVKWTFPEISKHMRNICSENNIVVRSGNEHLWFKLWFGGNERKLGSYDGQDWFVVGANLYDWEDASYKKRAALCSRLSDEEFEKIKEKLKLPYLRYGTLKKWEIARHRCQTCKGTGLNPKTTCPVCGGTGHCPLVGNCAEWDENRACWGMREKFDPFAGREYDEDTERWSDHDEDSPFPQCTCRMCGGSGRGRELCPTCGGDGYCADCHGSGYVKHCPDCGDGGGCKTCDGRGVVYCDGCSGSGKCGTCEGGGALVCERCKGSGNYQQYDRYTIKGIAQHRLYYGGEASDWLAQVEGENVYDGFWMKWRDEQHLVCGELAALKAAGEKCDPELFASLFERYKEKAAAERPQGDGVRPYARRARLTDIKGIKIEGTVNGEAFTVYHLGTNGYVVCQGVAREIAAFKTSMMSSIKNIFGVGRSKAVALMGVYALDNVGQKGELLEAALALAGVKPEEVTAYRPDKMSFEDVRKKLSAAFDTKKVSVFLWQLLAVGKEITAKETEIFTKVCDALAVSADEQEAFKRIAARMATLSPVEAAKEYLN